MPVAQALGIIEVGLPVLNLARRGDKPGALGRPLPDYDVWLRGEDGQPVAAADARPSKTGEICIRGPGLLRRLSRPVDPRARDRSSPTASAPATRATSTPTATCSSSAAARIASTWPA